MYVIIRRNLYYLQSANKSKLNGYAELQLPNYDFLYADKMCYYCGNDTLIYRQQVVNTEFYTGLYNYHCPVKMKFTLKPLPKTPISFKNVLIVPYNLVNYNIYHIVEGINSVLRYYLKWGKQFKVCRLEEL